MNLDPLAFKVDPMALDDISQAVAIEQIAYSLPDLKRDYLSELEYNRLAHYFVLRTQFPHKELSSSTIGVGGFWLLVDEIHIITVALNPGWQGLGLGEWMLFRLLQEGQTLGANVASLEVRPSNHTAISLYQKYNFQEVGRRIRYYNDNGEDALIFTTPMLLLPDYQAMLAQRKTNLLRRLAQIKSNGISQVN